jgi:hypothetical protein
MDRAAGIEGAARAGAVSRKLVQLRSGLKAQVHAVMAKEGATPAVTDIFGPAAETRGVQPSAVANG